MLSLLLLLFCNIILIIINYKSVFLWSERPGFNPRSSHTKDSKLVFDTSLLNTQHYKVHIKGKVVAIEKGAFRTPSTTVNQLYLLTHGVKAYVCGYKAEVNLSLSPA